jgi:ABC-type glycerol-3-phosphate transport system substrate-binding protein
MKRTITRPLAVAASAALLVGAAACSSDGGGSGEDDNVITIFSQQGPDRDLNGSTFTKLIEEEFDDDVGRGIGRRGAPDRARER